MRIVNGTWTKVREIIETLTAVTTGLSRAGARSAMLAVLLTLGLTAEPVHAALPQPSVDGVVVMDSLLMIHGDDLDAGGAPSVKLGAIPLSLQASSADQLLVRLPAGLDAGTYTLMLTWPNDGPDTRIGVPFSIARRIQTTSFFGASRPSIAGNAASYVFVGALPATIGNVVITRPYQRIVGAATAALGLAGGSLTQTVDVGLCYQNEAGGTIVNFVGGSYITFFAMPTRATYSATASVAMPTPGTYRVGICVRNNGGAQPLTNNDYLNGWVTVLD